MASVEYDAKKENEFSRLQLGTRIPNRLQELLDILNAREHQLEEWYFALLVKIMVSFAAVCRALAKTTGEETLAAAAWNARNMLELWIWTEYCLSSRESAWRFHEDAFRDAQGLVDLFAKMCELKDMRDEYSDSARKKLQELALLKLGTDTLDANYMRVAEAAKVVSLDKWYAAYNPYLSKFAHPTAGLVIGIMHQAEVLFQLQSVCTTFGLYFAGECVSALEKVIVAIPE